MNVKVSARFALDVALGPGLPAEIATATRMLVDSLTESAPATPPGPQLETLGLTGDFPGLNTSASCWRAAAG